MNATRNVAASYVQNNQEVVIFFFICLFFWAIVSGRLEAVLKTIVGPTDKASSGKSDSSDEPKPLPTPAPAPGEGVA